MIGDFYDLLGLGKFINLYLLLLLTHVISTEFQPPSFNNIKDDGIRRYVPTSLLQRNPLIDNRIDSDYEQKAPMDITQFLIDNIKETYIGANVRKLSLKPHLAGTSAQKDTAQQFYDTWLYVDELDLIKMETYDVLLTYPDVNKPNRVSLLDKSGNVVWVSGRDKLLTPGEIDDEDAVVQPYNAFSANGNVTATDIIYVNYGTYQDFDTLVNKMGISCVGKIGIARYGRIFRGSKVNNAENFKLAALILYSDPEDYATDGIGINQTYPNTWWLPDSGVQRGSLNLNSGDPLTFEYPAKPYVYREIPHKGLFPGIPVYPIGYNDASHLICGVKGLPIPVHWAKTLNCESIIANGGYKTIDDTLQVKIEVNNLLQTRTIYNVLGQIIGSVEPDRYVIIGNHRDAWVKGASDPVSGSGCLLEITRVFGLLLKSGWKPKRTIIFASWDGEESGLMGSTEWVEENLHILKERAIAYINVDTAVAGNYTPLIRGSRLLANLMFEAAKQVPNPDLEELERGHKTVFETWVQRSPDTTLNTNNKSAVLPSMGPLGSSSDFVPFQYTAGVPSIDMKYNFDTIPNFPVYHSRYDTYYDVVNFIDTGFLYHKAITQIAALTLLYLSESPILPFGIVDYAKTYRAQLQNIVRNNNQTLNKFGIKLDDLTTAVDEFIEAAMNFEKLNNMGSNLNGYQENGIGLKARIANDKLMQVERAFLNNDGIPINPKFKHLLSAPLSDDQNSGTNYPGLVEMLGLLADYDSNFEASSGKLVNNLIIQLLTTAQCSSTSSGNLEPLIDPKFLKIDESRVDVFSKSITDGLDADFINRMAAAQDVQSGENLGSQAYTFWLYYGYGTNKATVTPFLKSSIQKHISVITYTFKSATKTLNN